MAKRKSESEIVSQISQFHNSDSDANKKSLYKPGLRASAVIGIKKNISGHITHFYTQKYTQTPAVVGIKDDQV